MHTLLVGFDGFDPRVFERLYERGLMPNLGRLVDARGYAEFAVANPPQSEVSWTSIATGLNPGEHGMFDFVHRDAATYTPFASLLPTEKKFGVTRFVRPFSATTIFDMAAEKGYPSTSLWWPGTFPARSESPVRTLPGLGTPDVLGRLGVGVLYAADSSLPDTLGKTPVLRLEAVTKSRFQQHIFGPKQRKGSSEQTLSAPMQLEISDETNAVMDLGGATVELPLGAWSPILDIEFRVNRFLSVRAITRGILTEGLPSPKVYFLPLQLHPLKAIWPYGTPSSFVKSTWQECGPFLTLGWPQDTTGLQDGCINDQQFLALCESVSDSRAEVLLHHLDEFHEGLIGAVLDTLDRVQHMYWRDRPEIIEKWYIGLDRLLGRIIAKYPVEGADGRRLVIASDHGFDRMDYIVHLNRWLIEHGFLSTTEDGSGWKSIDWSGTTAYALGLNSIYLNLKSREAQGLVEPEAQAETCARIRDELLQWGGPDDGKPVVQHVSLNEEVFSGVLAEHGPDMVVGYAPGYRASSETGLGGWGARAIERNLDHWHGDHCFDARSVPGVLFANRNLAEISNPSYRHIPGMTVDAEPDSGSSGPPPTIGEEDEEVIEERLRSLGYL